MERYVRRSEVNDREIRNLSEDLQNVSKDKLQLQALVSQLEQEVGKLEQEVADLNFKLSKFQLESAQRAEELEAHCKAQRETIDKLTIENEQGRADRQRQLGEIEDLGERLARKEKQCENIQQQLQRYRVAEVLLTRMNTPLQSSDQGYMSAAEEIPWGSEADDQSLKMTRMAYLVLYIIGFIIAAATMI